MTLSSAETMGAVNKVFDTVNLHRPTSLCAAEAGGGGAASDPPPRFSSPAKSLPRTRGGPTRDQGLTLVHIFAQPEPCLSLKPAKHPSTWDKKCSR